MPTPNEIERIAAMGNALRPDWPIKSLRSYLAANLGTRTYQDLAIALAYIATDPATQTPARLLENGPWWAATAAHSVKAGQRQKCAEHNIPLTSGNCTHCIEHAAEHVPGRASQMWAHIKQQLRQEAQR